MIVSKLIQKLQECEPNALVVLASDGEGNEYSPLAGLVEGFYVPESTWNGRLIDDEDIEDYEDEGVDAIVIYPIN